MLKNIYNEKKAAQAAAYFLLRASGALLPGDFWQAMSFDELAAAQGVRPLTNIDALVGVWPGDVDDGFEESVHKLRQANVKAA